jgi:hypothetical protein
MTKQRMGDLVLCVFLALGAAREAQAQDVKAPEQPGVQFNERVVELTKPVVQGLIKGLEVELGLLTEFDKLLATYKTEEEYDECKNRVVLSPEGMRIALQFANLPANTTQEQVQRLTEKMNVDMQALLRTKCGPSISEEWTDYKRREKIEEIHGTGAEAAGLLLSSSAPQQRGGPAIDEAAEEVQAQKKRTDKMDIAIERIKLYCAYKKMSPSMFPMPPGVNLSIMANRFNPNATGVIFFTAAEIEAIDYQCDGPVIVVAGEVEIIMDAIYIRGKRPKR